MTKSIGDFERYVLLAVLRRGEQAYGVTIRDEIQERTGRAPAFGAIYTTLSRLEKKGMVDSHEGDPTEVRGGRAKKFYRVTGLGMSVLNSSLKDLDVMRAGLSLPWVSA